MGAPRVFDQAHYEILNHARGEVVSRLLAELTPPLNLRTAIDVGCGLGYFACVLASLGLEVTAVDGRQQNVEEAQRRNPAIKFLRFDAEDPALRSLGSFDLVFCFGLLYHLENPFLAIRHLHAMTRSLLLVESVIFPGEQPVMGLVQEWQGQDQGLNYAAFYPTEACLQKMFYRAGFRFVYRLAETPQMPEYRQTGHLPKVRVVLAASNDPVRSSQLEVVSEPSMPIQPWDPRSVAANTSAAEALRGFSKRSFQDKLGIVARLVRRKLPVGDGH